MTYNSAGSNLFLQSLMHAPERLFSDPGKRISYADNGVPMAGVDRLHLMGLQPFE